MQLTPIILVSINLIGTNKTNTDCNKVRCGGKKTPQPVTVSGILHSFNVKKRAGEMTCLNFGPKAQRIKEALTCGLSKNKGQRSFDAKQQTILILQLPSILILIKLNHSQQL